MKNKNKLIIARRNILSKRYRTRLYYYYVYYYFLNHEDGGNLFFRNVDIRLQDCMVLQPIAIINNVNV
jgi:hypothetical protein